MAVNVAIAFPAFFQQPVGKETVRVRAVDLLGVPCPGPGRAQLHYFPRFQISTSCDCTGQLCQGGS